MKSQTKVLSLWPDDLTFYYAMISIANRELDKYGLAELLESLVAK